MKKSFARMISVAILLTASLMMLIVQIAFAEEFGCMDVIAFLTERTGRIPTQLRPYVQPVSLESEEGALRVQLIDALFVDGAIAVAWTVENTGSEPLYIANASNIGEWQPISIWYEGSGGILAPGEVRNCGYAGYLSGWQMPEHETGTHLLSLSIAGLRLLGEPVYWDETAAPAESEQERIARNDIVDALFEEGKVVIDQYGELQPGHLPKVIYYDTYSDTPARAQMLFQSGKAAEHSQVTMETPIVMNRSKRSILPDMSAISDAFEGEITLERAELSDVKLIVEASFSFPDKASALAFYNARDRDAPFPTLVMESDGNKDFYGMVNAVFAQDEFSRMTEPEHQDNGAYVWHFVSKYWFIVPNKNGYQFVVE